MKLTYNPSSTIFLLTLLSYTQDNRIRMIIKANPGALQDKATKAAHKYIYGIETMK